MIFITRLNGLNLQTNIAFWLKNTKFASRKSQVTSRKSQVISRKLKTQVASQNCPPGLPYQTAWIWM